jgi:hypothetical protein
MSATDSAYPTEASGAAPMGGSYGTDPSSASIGELMSEIASDLSTLMRKEVELAKAEIKTEATKAGKAAGMLGGAAYGGHMVLLFASFALLFALSASVGLGWAGLIVTAIWAVIATVLALRGRAQLRQVHPKPERTVQTLKEDAQWARHPTS